MSWQAHCTYIVLNYLGTYVRVFRLTYEYLRKSEYVSLFALYKDTQSENFVIKSILEVYKMIMLG